MKAINRFIQYCDFKGIKPSRFEKDYGVSNGYFSVQLKRNGSLGEDSLNIITDNCLDLSPEWLLTGKGEMLKNLVEKEIIKEEPIIFREQLDDKNEIIKLLREKIEKLENENNKLKKEKKATEYNIHVAKPGKELKK
jgi:hypothetical protein